MTRPMTNPSELKPSDVEAHAVLDDDGNPLHNPLDAVPDTGSWRERFDAATAALRQHSLLAMGIALGAGYLIGRALAARAGS